jgi:predicted HTH domain antitoxin
MAMKDLSVRKVSELSGVPYAQVSQILNGRLIHPEYFDKIKRAIRNARTPETAIAA